jgi:polyphosphate glucokinase
MKILIVDVGGTNVKLKLSDGDEVRKYPSGPDMHPQQMVDGVRELTRNWQYDAVTVGYPGVVSKSGIIKDPVNLGIGWVGFDFAAAFNKPVRLINDAAMQALGSYEGGRMLFLGLGTGLGSSMIVDKVIMPMELGHLPYRKKRSFEDYVGERGRKRLGRMKWQEAVADVVHRLRNALVAEYVVLGGGNAKRLSQLPDGARLGNNENAFIGGARLWRDYPDW